MGRMLDSHARPEVQVHGFAQYGEGSADECLARNDCRTRGPVSYTHLEYNCETLIPDTLYSVTMHIGFRIEPRVSLYLRQVVEDLVTCLLYTSLSVMPSRLRQVGSSVSQK